LDAKDDVTDLAGRSLFEEEVQFAIDGGGSDRWCLVLVELTDLDRVEAAHGPAGSNAVLVAVAERLRRSVRPRDLVARLEGGKFAILFEEVAPAVVDQIVRRVLRTVNEPVPVAADLVRVEANLGVAQSASAEDARLLMARADTALARARATPTAGYAWFAEITEHGT
jgi:diguanylate cyclase (GGDEF)-like protein